MKKIPLFRLTVLLLVFFASLSICNAQQYKRSIRNPERQLFGKSLNNKTVRYRESRDVKRAKKKQAANQKKLDKEYYRYVKEQRKHNYEIQSPEVKSRMTENRKETEQKYKEMKKNRKEKTKKAGNKYDK
jgi:hypothetical protein